MKLFMRAVRAILTVMTGLMLVMAVVYWPLNHLSTLLYVTTAAVLGLARHRAKAV